MHASSADLATAPVSASLGRSLGVSWPLLLGLAGFLVPVLLGFGLADSDTYLHISVGRWMLAHGSILTHDPFSFTRHGAILTTQEWGSDLIIAATFRAAGWSGLVALSAVSFGATLAYLARFLLARMEPLHALLLTLLAAFMMFPSLLARPHELVWPLTAVWAGMLVRSSEEHRAPPWWLLAVMLLWVNLHGSFIAGLALAVFIAADSVVEARGRRREVARRWLAFVLATLACGFVNPQGYHLMLFPFHLLGMKAALSLIAEWRPPDFEQPQILGLWLILILGLALIGRVRLSVVRSILILGLLYAALQHIRNVALLGLIFPFLLAQPVAALWRRMPVRGRDADAVDRWFRALVSPARPAAICVAVALAGLAAVVALNLRQPRPPEYARPRAALDAVLSRAPRGRILNDPAFGDYLIYRRIPDFMDDRVDLYGDAFMRETAAALELAPGGDLEALLRKYRIAAIVLGAEWPAVRLLDRLPGWKRVYSSQVAVAYVRRGASGP